MPKFLIVMCICGIFATVTVLWGIEVPSFGRFYNLAQILIEHGIFLAQ